MDIVDFEIGMAGRRTATAIAEERALLRQLGLMRASESAFSFVVFAAVRGVV